MTLLVAGNVLQETLSYCSAGYRGLPLYHRFYITYDFSTNIMAVFVDRNLIVCRGLELHD